MLEKWQGVPSEGLEVLCLVASLATPIDAMTGVYFLVDPRGTFQKGRAGHSWEALAKERSG